ncbi:hypothetical protein ACJZ2D_008629 [Fusarium nematophilum]
MQIFNPKYKKPMQMVQVVVIVVVFILVCVRLSKGTSTFDVLALLMALASFFLICYQLVTQSVIKYRHWGNSKVYFFINVSETALWTIIMIIGIATNMKKCTSGSGKGTSSCHVFLALSGIAGIISQITGYTLVLYWRDWRSPRHRPNDESPADGLPTTGNDSIQYFRPTVPASPTNTINPNSTSYPKQTQQSSTLGLGYEPHHSLSSQSRRHSQLGGRAQRESYNYHHQRWPSVEEQYSAQGSQHQQRGLSRDHFQPQPPNYTYRPNTVTDTDASDYR